MACQRKLDRDKRGGKKKEKKKEQERKENPNKTWIQYISSVCKCIIKNKSNQKSNHW